MNKHFRIIAALLAVLFALGLAAGCGNKPAAPAETVIKVGVTAGPNAEVMEIVKKVAEKDGLKIQIVEFNDYIQPNVALNQGDIDVNSYQHQPFLDNQVKDRGYSLVSIAKTVVFPMGIYSKKIKNVADIKAGAEVAIPNDPTNGARGLLVLQKSGLIKIRPEAGLRATPADIIENPKNIKIKELDAAQIPRSLDDLDLAAINTNYAIVAGLIPTKDAIVIESGDSPYSLVLAVQTKNKDNPAFQKLIKAYHSDEVKKYINEHFQGSVVATW